MLEIICTHVKSGIDCHYVVIFVQNYLVNILLDTATKEHTEGARYVGDNFW